MVEDVDVTKSCQDGEKEINVDTNSIAKKKKSNMYGYLTLFGGTLQMMVTGSVYITGNITPYITSYFNVDITYAQ
jgi:hypothetical protein